MKRLALPALLMLALIAPETRATGSVTGYASAYAPGVMDATVRYRLDHGLWWQPPPRDWYTVHGYVATNDCTQVGHVMTLVAPDGREYRVLVADCGGAEPGGGSTWMTANNIVAELDWRLWQQLTARYGRPLEVELRYGG